MQTNPKHEWFKLRKNSIKFLFAYYILLLLISMSLILKEALHYLILDIKNIFFCSLRISISFSLLGATVFYIRKLYKACINLDIIIPFEPSDSIREMGVIAYFILRPIFAVIFSIIILVTLKSGIGILSASDTLTNQFYYLSIIISFFIGFSAGNVVDKFETLGKEIVEKVSNIKI